MDRQVDHVIEVRTVDGNGEVIARDVFSPSSFTSPLAPSKNINYVKGAAITSALQRITANIFVKGMSNIEQLTGGNNLLDKATGAAQIASFIPQLIVSPIIGGINMVSDVSARIYDFEINRAINLTKTEYLRERTGMVRISGGRRW